MAATQALETITLRCGWGGGGGGGGGTKNGRACAQDALLPSNESHAYQSEKQGGREGVLFETSTGSVSYSGGGGVASKTDGACDVSAVSTTTGRSLTEPDGDDEGNTTTDSQGRETIVGLARDKKRAEGMENSNLRRRRAEWEREDTAIGATSFALRLADSYSRDDSRTIVRRAGAARVAASALSLLRALLTDGGQRRQVEGDVETGGGRDAETEGDEDGDEASLACCVREFCEEQVVLSLDMLCTRTTFLTHRRERVEPMA